jgi:hypothetical protein
MDQDRVGVRIAQECLEVVNRTLEDPDNHTVGELLDLVERYGGPEEINRKAAEARRLENLLVRLDEGGSPYLADIQWLIGQRDTGAFIPMAEYRTKVIGDESASARFDEANAVTLEISALQFFPG